MTTIIIRRIIGGAVLVAGWILLEKDISEIGSIGVLLMIMGVLIVSGIKGYYWTPSQELKAKQEKKTTASE
ncbi:hypothetical protein HQ587_06240 [bacterium]|nr:hypothetical protein [bacterium]